MNVRVGICSRCGGDVMGFRGAWMSITPPPPDRCGRCGGYVCSEIIHIVEAPARDNKQKEDEFISMLDNMLKRAQEAK